VASGFLIGFVFGRKQGNILRYIPASVFAGFVTLSIGSVTGLAGSGWLADMALGVLGAIVGAIILSQSR
jgi:uncharacterized membrane protein YeaQ/YmgE (transglycosylase-associated protein family)